MHPTGTSPRVGNWQESHIFAISAVAVGLVSLMAFAVSAATPDADAKAVAKAAKKTAKADAKAAAKGDAAGALPANNLSFVKNIAPILVAKCARCHINTTKGKFSMATFESLKKGPPDGVVFAPGKSIGSRLIDVIESGDMPRAGPKVTKPELTAIGKWIDEGAKFDGNDEKAPLTKLVPGAGTPPANGKADEPKLAVVTATGRETVQFSRDISPVLVENCMGCHGGQQPTGRLQMDRFVDMIKGGQSGNPWVPDKPAESLLIKKLIGTAGKRMPLDKPALPPEVIGKFETWIAEGARFDGAAPTQSTRLLAALVRAKSATHEELSADRTTAGRRQWALASPTEKPTVHQTKNLIVIGSQPDAILQDLADTAEQQAEIVSKQLHALTGQPLVKGRIVLFVMPNHYEYSEFGRMVENRQVPATSRGHWKYDMVDAYGVVVPPSDPSDYSVGALIAQQLASVYVASLAGNPPSWFAEGSGRVVASRLDAKSARTHDWNDRLRELAGSGKLETFVTRGLPPQDANIAAYGFMKELMSNGGKYTSLVNAMRGGEDFDHAFPRVFGPLPTLAAGWAKSVKP